MTETASPVTKENAKFYAVVPAAGVGRRMGSDQPKQYLPILGKTVLEYTLATLLTEPQLRRVVVAIAAEDSEWCSLSIFDHPRIEVIEGGDERSHSVLNGLQHLSIDCSGNDWVLVHDVVRPCIALSDIRKIIEQLADDTVGGILAVPVSDTIKQVNSSGAITTTVDRSLLWQAQTPQMFRLGLLRDALAEGIAKQANLTDDASAVELAGLTPKVVEGSRANIKITCPEDLSLAEYYLQKEVLS
ncbi:MAG: 2-C-methyl-D-erythritol 4-phosphate cytidylyltransferase [Pseudomonadales bacterium]